MTSHLIWALVAAFWALVLWDMVRRWAFATATRTLKADLTALEQRFADMRADKLPDRVKQLETVVVGLRAHAQTQAQARKNPFLRQAGG